MFLVSMISRFMHHPSSHLLEMQRERCTCGTTDFEYIITRLNILMLLDIQIVAGLYHLIIERALLDIDDTHLCGC